MRLASARGARIFTCPRPPGGGDPTCAWRGAAGHERDDSEEKERGCTKKMRRRGKGEGGRMRKDEEEQEKEEAEEGREEGWGEEHKENDEELDVLEVVVAAKPEKI